MVLQMTLDEIKNRVPSSITIMPPRGGVIDIMLDGFYVGFLYDTSEGIYVKTWIPTWDDCSKLNVFLSYFKFELLFNIRLPRSEYRVYRLIE